MAQHQKWKVLMLSDAAEGYPPVTAILSPGTIVHAPVGAYALDALRRHRRVGRCCVEPTGGRAGLWPQGSMPTSTKWVCTSCARGASTRAGRRTGTSGWSARRSRSTRPDRQDFDARLLAILVMQSKRLSMPDVDRLVRSTRVAVLGGYAARWEAAAVLASPRGLRRPHARHLGPAGGTRVGEGGLGAGAARGAPDLGEAGSLGRAVATAAGGRRPGGHAAR